MGRLASCLCFTYLLLLLMPFVNIYAAYPNTAFGTTHDVVTCRRRSRLVAPGRRCMKPCHRNRLRCKDKKKLKVCLCDTACGLSCIDPTKTCPQPEEIPYGTYHVTNSAQFDAKLRYKCHFGYILVGHYERRCQGDGTWSGAPPRCINRAMQCSPITAPPNGKIHSHYYGYRYGAEISFECNPGYSLHGPATIMCLSDGQWSSYKPSCHADCGVRPPPLIDGMVRFHSLRHGSRARYRCYRGYQMRGAPKHYVDRRCQDGVWTGMTPECVQKKCRHDRMPVKNGKIILVGYQGKYKYDKHITRVYHHYEIEYRCNKYFRLVGPKGATCVNGDWSPRETPKCVAKSHTMKYYSLARIR